MESRRDVHLHIGRLDEWVVPRDYEGGSRQGMATRRRRSRLIPTGSPSKARTSNLKVAGSVVFLGITSHCTRNKKEMDRLHREV